MTREANYDVDDPKIKALLVVLGARLKAKMPDGWGFTLTMFTYEAEPRKFFYVSTVVREDMFALLREWVDREADAEIQGTEN